MAAPPPISLKGRALRYLAAREHSRAELLRKLAPHAQEPGEIERVLDELQAKGFISAERVAASLLHRQRAQAVWQRKFGLPAPDAAGRARQMRFLLGRGFSADVVRRVVQGIHEDEG